MFSDRHTRPRRAGHRECRVHNPPPAAGRAWDNSWHLFPSAWFPPFCCSLKNRLTTPQKRRRSGSTNFSCVSFTFESIPFCSLKVEFFIARDDIFCHVSDGYRNVVLCFQAAAAHDPAPAGRFVAHLSAHGPVAGQLLHRALAKPANLAGNHRAPQGAIPSRPTVVCPILLLVQKRFARRLWLLDGLQNPRHLAHRPTVVEYLSAFLLCAHYCVGHRHSARHLGGGQKRFMG